MKKSSFLNKCKNYVGMRNIKTALAVAVSVLIAEIFNLKSPFFVANGALMTMETSVKKGINTGISAVLGTVIGCIIGIITVLIDPRNILLLFVGIVVLITLLNILKWQDSISMACVVFCLIVINMENENLVIYGIERTVDTIVGISISLIINYLISPPCDPKLKKNSTRDGKVEKSIEDKLESGDIIVDEIKYRTKDGLKDNLEDTLINS